MGQKEGEGMMKTYAIRKALRTATHCQFCYFSDGTLAHGTIWDLSETGWRATGAHPIAAGTETTVTITLSNGKRSRNILIDQAVVRWSRGNHTGWEIIKMDPEAREQLMGFMEHCKTTSSTVEVAEEIRWY